VPNLSQKQPVCGKYIGVADGCVDLRTCAAGDSYSRLVTGGGRVVTVVALGSSPEEARLRAYGVAEGITYTGRVYRQDIGAATGE